MGRPWPKTATRTDVLPSWCSATGVGAMRYRQSCWLGGCLSQPRNQAATPARLLSSYSSLHVPVNGDCNVMDEPRVPLLVRLQVCGQRMTVWALLMGGGLVLGLLHGAAPPRKKGLPPPWHEPDPPSTIRRLTRIGASSHRRWGGTTPSASLEHRCAALEEGADAVGGISAS